MLFTCMYVVGLFCISYAADYKFMADNPAIELGALIDRVEFSATLIEHKPSLAHTPLEQLHAY